MILLLLREDPSWAPILAGAGVHVVHYRDPLKALDNLSELDPGFLVVDRDDFPRHWKALVQDLRTRRPADEVPAWAAGRRPLAADEASKAACLGAREASADPEALADLVRGALKGAVAPVPRPLPFLFRHPRARHLVTGVLTRWDGAQATFRPDFDTEIEDLTPGEDLAGASLKVDHEFLTLDTVITKNNGQLHLAVRPLEAVR